MKERGGILQAAKEAVTVDRGYGSVEDNFKLIAELWSAIFGVCVCPHDVSLAMIALKMARIKTGASNVDNWVDIAGYAACGGEINQHYIGWLSDEEFKVAYADFLKHKEDEKLTD